MSTERWIVGRLRPAGHNVRSVHGGHALTTHSSGETMVLRPGRISVPSYGEPVVPDIRYAPGRDVSIAYQVVGEGDLDLVFVPGFVSHMEKYWDGFMAHNLVRLSERCRLITFDKRGTGLSDRDLGIGSIESRMDDVRAVMDHAGSERAALLGLSEGGPMSIVFAATYPERVTSLVLWGTFATTAAGSEERDTLFTLVRDEWGTGTVMPIFVQNLADDEATRAYMASFERNACTPKVAGDLLELNLGIDVTSALSAVTAPTLVIHRTGDPVVPIELARAMADGIDGAEFLELDGATHVNGDVGGDDDALDAALDFITGTTRAPVHDVDRVLATVLLTDIVDSTARAVKMGDSAWRELLEQHDRVSVAEIERQRGRVVKSTGDGLLATFDGPARGVRAAQAIVEGVRPLGIEVRAGLHTGELELRGDDVAGIAVHVGARVGGMAKGGEVLVSGTVKDLVLGSGLDFESRGAQELKGVPGEWPLFALAG